MTNPSSDMRSWMNISDGRRVLMESQDALNELMDTKAFTNDAWAVEKEKVDNFSHAVDGLDFSQKANVAKFLVRLNRVITQVREILEHYSSMMKNDGAAHPIGIEKLVAGVTEFQTTIKGVVQTINSVQEESYKDHYDSITAKMTEVKDVLTAVIEHIKPVLKAQGFGKFQDQVVKVLKIIAQFPAAIDHFNHQVEEVVKMSNFDKMAKGRTTTVNR